MTVLLVAAGAVILLVAFFDVTWTTIGAGAGAGPLTGRLSRALWRAALRLHRRTDRAVLTPAGVLIVVSVLLTWIVLVLAGWMLVFSSAVGAVRSASTNVPGDLVDRAYFTGYTVFTLGLGDYAPGDGPWQLATVAATGSGLLLVTLSVTYLVPVVSAVVQRRQLAGQVGSLGDGSVDIVRQAWNGTDFGSLPQTLSSLLPLLHTLRLQHLSYPVLHFFHSPARDDAAAVRLVHLHGVVMILRAGVDADVRPDTQTLDSLERAIDQFLATMDGVQINGDHSPVPAPDLGPLAEAGVPIDERTYQGHVQDRDRSRRLLHAYLADDGWTLDDLVIP